MNTETNYLSVIDLKSLPEEKKFDFQSILTLRKVSKKEARNGNPFLSVELADATGSFVTNCFPGTPFDILSQATPGCVLKIGGQTDFFNGKLSPRLQEISPLDPEAAEKWLPKLIETPEEDIQSLWTELQEHIASIEHEKLRQTAENAFSEDPKLFQSSSAAVSMHHAYRSGLLEHTIHVVRALKAIIPLYSGINKDLALTGALLHDIGKTIEYEGDVSVKKTRTGILQGHVVLGYRIARKAALKAGLDPELTEQLEHIILSHQGELSWGAAVMAATPEAVLVSLVDNLDAKMAMVTEAIKKTPDNEIFSDYIPGLQSKVLNSGPTNS